jgi:hypothetical protein
VGEALEGRQSGPSCTQNLAGMDADVVKLEAPGGDITRKQLRDIPDVDKLYFTMLRPPDETVRLPGRRPSLPLLSEHNEDIYGRELGRDDQLASLKAKRSSCRSVSCDHRRCRPASIKRI